MKLTKLPFSRWVKAIGWENGLLEAHTAGGIIYHHKNVPQEAFTKFFETPDYSSNYSIIKAKYRGRRIN